MLLIDHVLPRYDVAVAHAAVFRAPPEVCYRAARRLDLLRHPVVRGLLALRSLPQLAAGRRLPSRGGTAARPPARTFSLDDMVRPPLNWLLLGEEPGVEIVLGQVARPWKPVATSTAPPVTPAGFASFNEAGHAKIVFSLRVDPYGATSSLLTMETRVALTDPDSRRRFRRYWVLIGPFSGLIRRIALRLLDAELRQAEARDPLAQPENGGSGMAHIEGEIVINRPVETVFAVVADERNEPRYNPRLRRVEKTSAGPIGPGARFRAETVTMGRTAEMVIEWTDFEPPRRLGSSTHLSSMDIHGTLTFDPVPGGTRMRWAWDLQPRGLLRLLRPLVARLGQRQEQAIWAGLKRYLEQHQTPPVPHDPGPAQ